jgi:hypothetical protein
MADWFDPVRECVIAGESPYGLVKEMLAAGIERDTVYAALEQFRAELREADNEPAEDIVMDTMDCFHGWCAPVLRL